MQNFGKPRIYDVFLFAMFIVIALLIATIFIIEPSFIYTRDSNSTAVQDIRYEIDFNSIPTIINGITSSTSIIIGFTSAVIGIFYRIFRNDNTTKQILLFSAFFECVSLALLLMAYDLLIVGYVILPLRIALIAFALSFLNVAIVMLGSFRRLAQKTNTPENSSQVKKATDETENIPKQTKEGNESPEDKILSLIRLIDGRQDLFRWYDAFYGWSTLLVVLVALYVFVEPIMLSVELLDKAFLLLSLLAVVAALLSLYIPFTKGNIINKNFQRLEKQVNENDKPILRALLKMKAENTDFDLEQIYNMNPNMFTVEILLARLYE